MEDFFSGASRSSSDHVEAEGLGDGDFTRGMRMVSAAEKLVRPAHDVLHRLGADEHQCELLLQDPAATQTLLDLLGGIDPPLLLCWTADSTGFFAGRATKRLSASRVLHLSNTLLRIGLRKAMVLDLLTTARHVCKSDKDVDMLDQGLFDYAKADSAVIPKSAPALEKLTVSRTTMRPFGPTAREIEDLLAALDQALADGNDEFVAQIGAVVAALDAPKAGRLRTLKAFWESREWEGVVDCSNLVLATQVRLRLNAHECLVVTQDRKKRADLLLAQLQAEGLSFDFSPDLEIRFTDPARYEPATHANLMLEYLSQLAANPAHDPNLTVGVAKLLRAAVKPVDFNMSSFCMLYALAGLGTIDKDMQPKEACKFAREVCEDTRELVAMQCGATLVTLARADDPYRLLCAHALHREVCKRFGKDAVSKLSKPVQTAVERVRVKLASQGSIGRLTLPDDAARALVEESNSDSLWLIEQIHLAFAKFGHADALAELTCFEPYIGETAAGSNGRHLLAILIDHPNVKKSLYLQWAHAIRLKVDPDEVFDLHLETIRLNKQLDAVLREDKARVVATRISISRITIAVMCLARSLELHVEALGLRFEPKATPAGMKKTVRAKLAPRAILKLEELEDFARSRLKTVDSALLGMAAYLKSAGLIDAMNDEVARLRRQVDSVWELSA